MPAAPLLAHQPVLLQRREHAIEVVLLDADRLGDLGDGDPRARANELERLLGTRTAAARTAAPPGALTRRAPRAAAAARRRGRGVACAGGQSLKRRGGGFEPVVFVDERAQLLQPGIDLALLLFQEVGHGLSLTGQ